MLHVQLLERDQIMTNSILIKLLISFMLPIFFYLFSHSSFKTLLLEATLHSHLLLAHSWALRKVVNVLLNCALQNASSSSICTLLNIISSANSLHLYTSFNNSLSPFSAVCLSVTVSELFHFPHTRDYPKYT